MMSIELTLILWVRRHQWKLLEEFKVNKVLILFFFALWQLSIIGEICYAFEGHQTILDAFGWMHYFGNKSHVYIYTRYISLFINLKIHIWAWGCATMRILYHVLGKTTTFEMIQLLVIWVFSRYKYFFVF